MSHFLKHSFNAVTSMLTISLLCGCAVRTNTVEVISEPPGARIEYNNEYMGDAPCKIEIPVGLFGGVTTFNPVITATPKGAGEVQTKRIGMGLGAVPEKIYFNTNLTRVAPIARVDEKVKVDVTTKSESDSKSDIYVQLMKLNELKKEGIITDDEFAAKKKKLLGL